MPLLTIMMNKDVNGAASYVSFQLASVMNLIHIGVCINDDCKMTD